MEILTLVMVVISTATTVLFGVWRIAAHYETRNEKAHGELRAAIDKANESNNTAHEGLSTRIDGVRTELHGDNAALRTELHAVAANVNILVGRQQERDRVAD